MNATDDTNTMTLADIIRAVRGNLTRQELKVQRAKLRRRGVTNLNRARRNAPYHVDPTTERRTDHRADSGVVVISAAL